MYIYKDGLENTQEQHELVSSVELDKFRWLTFHVQLNS